LYDLKNDIISIAKQLKEQDTQMPTLLEQLDVLGREQLRRLITQLCIDIGDDLQEDIQKWKGQDPMLHTILDVLDGFGNIKLRGVILDACIRMIRSRRKFIASPESGSSNIPSRRLSWTILLVLPTSSFAV
jgi:hypothetical protein